MIVTLCGLVMLIDQIQHQGTIVRYISANTPQPDAQFEYQQAFLDHASVSNCKQKKMTLTAHKRQARYDLDVASSFDPWVVNGL